MIPLKDDNPTSGRPTVTYVLIGICVLVFFMQLGSQSYKTGQLFYSYGLIPSVLMGHDQLPMDLYVVPAYMTIFSSMFMHGGFMHLIGNMLYMWIFADNIEDSLGPKNFIIFYLLSGIGAAIAQVLMDTHSQIPMVGASGVVLRVENDLCTLTHTILGGLSKSESFKTDHHTYGNSEQLVGLDLSTGSIRSGIERRQLRLVVHAKNSALFRENDRRVVRLALMRVRFERRLGAENAGNAMPAADGGDGLRSPLRAGDGGSGGEGCPRCSCPKKRGRRERKIRGSL